MRGRRRGSPGRGKTELKNPGQRECTASWHANRNVSCARMGWGTRGSVKIHQKREQGEKKGESTRTSVGVIPLARRNTRFFFFSNCKRYQCTNSSRGRGDAQRGGCLQPNLQGKMIGGPYSPGGVVEKSGLAFKKEENA